MGLRRFTLGVLVGILLVGCAGLFPHKHYGIEAENYAGKLLGPTPADDLSFELCKPDAVDKGKCIIMLRDAFFRMKQEYEDMFIRLQECERP